MSGKAPIITYDNKTNVNPIIDRTKQSTAEDWIEVKSIVNILSALLHIESDDIALLDSYSHQVDFVDSYNLPDAYCIIKLSVYWIDSSDGDDVIVEVGIKNLVKNQSNFTFETYIKRADLRIDYHILPRNTSA